MFKNSFDALCCKVSSGKYKNTDEPLQESLNQLNNLIIGKAVAVTRPEDKYEYYRQKYYNLTGVDPLSEEFTELDIKAAEALNNGARS